MHTIDIDVGGTFTDGVFARGGVVRHAKVFTTPHDLAVGILNCVAAGAELFGLEGASGGPLRHTAVFRLSTTVGTNAIIQKTGPKIGVLVTAGHERNLYGPAGDAQPVQSLLSPAMVRGVPEAIDDRGAVATPLDEQAALAAVRDLVNLGARMLVVALKNAPANPVHEQRIKQLVAATYPEHYLRRVITQTGTEVSDLPYDSERTNATLVNAYLHRDMVRNLYKIEDQLRLHGLQRPMLVVHNTEGTARVAKTRAIDTYSSGPAAGLVGAASIAARYGFAQAITADVGGTSIDVGLIGHGQFEFDTQPEIAGIRTGLPMIRVGSIGAGGGSIARLAGDGIAVGPNSAGSVPGPACYGKGGSEPTVTDADVVLGLIDPQYFLGGQYQLQPDLARQAIAERLARPLGLSTEEAALNIRLQVERNIAAYLHKLVTERGRRPAEFVLFAFGGAGAVHACGYAQAAGIKRVLTFPFGSVFNAYGASTMNVVHRYMTSTPTWRNPDADLNLGETVARLQSRARRDMRGEGFGADDLRYRLELIFADPAGAHRVVVSGRDLTPATAAAAPLRKQLAALCAQAEAQVGPGAPALWLESVVLTAEAPVPHPDLPEFPAADADPSPAYKGNRPVYWSVSGGYVAAAVYAAEQLRPGNCLSGPAIVEAADTVCPVLPDWKYQVDRFGNGMLTHTG